MNLLELSVGAMISFAIGLLVNYISPGLFRFISATRLSSIEIEMSTWRSAIENPHQLILASLQKIALIGVLSTVALWFGFVGRSDAEAGLIVALLGGKEDGLVDQGIHVESLGGGIFTWLAMQTFSLWIFTRRAQRPQVWLEKLGRRLEAAAHRIGQTS